MNEKRIATISKNEKNLNQKRYTKLFILIKKYYDQKT